MNTLLGMKLAHFKGKSWFKRKTKSEKTSLCDLSSLVCYSLNVLDLGSWYEDLYKW